MEPVQRTKQKGGRPKKTVTRSQTTGVRFTKAERFVVLEKARKAGVRSTTYIRMMAIQGMIHSRLTEEERGFIRQLIGLSNNINQIAKACHDQGMLTAMHYFKGYRDQLDGILQKLKV